MKKLIEEALAKYEELVIDVQKLRRLLMEDGLGQDEYDDKEKKEKQLEEIKLSILALIPFPDAHRELVKELRDAADQEDNAVGCQQDYYHSELLRKAADALEGKR